MQTIYSVADVEQLSIFSMDSEGVVTDFDNLEDHYIQCTLQQSLFTPEIYLDILISESKGTLTRFNKVGYQGQEFVVLKFTSNADPDKKFLISMQFWVKSIDGVVMDESFQSSAMTLKCVSKEVLISGIRNINRSFNTSYSNAAKVIFENYIQKPTQTTLVNKNTSFVKPTLEKINHEGHIENKFIIPGMNPFQAIYWCNRRNYQKTESGNMPAAAWTFYQQMGDHKYKLVNIEELILKGAQTDVPSMKQLYMQAIPGPGDGDKTHNILKISNIDTPDARRDVFDGSYHNTVHTIDYYNKNFYHVVYDARKKFIDHPHLSKRMNVDDMFLDMFCNAPSHTTNFYQDSTKPNAPASQNYGSILGARRYFHRALHNIRAEVTLHGFTGFQAGEVVSVFIPEASGIQDPEGRTDTKFSGKWLVSTVTHVFNRSDFKTRLHLLKDSVQNSTKVT